MTSSSEPPPQSIVNFRDVASFVNKITNTTKLNIGQFYRSARPDDASFQDIQRLKKDFKIASIIDLRTKTEHIQQSQKHNNSLPSNSNIPKSNSTPALSLQIPGITTYPINFNGTSFSLMLISKLTWFEFFRLLFLMALGYRIDAIRILSPHLEAMGLVGLATKSLDVCTREIKAVFDVLGDEGNWPVLVHCTQGKDRTGLVVMLVLFLAGVEVQVVDEDYRRSEVELEGEMEERLVEIREIGLSERFAVCPREVVSAVDRHLKERYGGVEAYLKDIVGVSGETIEFVKRKVVVMEDS